MLGLFLHTVPLCLARNIPRLVYSKLTNEAAIGFEEDVVVDFQEYFNILQWSRHYAAHLQQVPLIDLMMGFDVHAEGNLGFCKIHTGKVKAPCLAGNVMAT